MSRAETHKRVFRMFGRRGALVRGAALAVVERQTPQPKKEPDMFKSKLALVVVTLASLGNGSAFAQEDRGTPEQRAACAPDAFRLCVSYIPDATRVETCLRQRRSDLSEACRLVFEHGTPTAAVRGK